MSNGTPGNSGGGDPNTILFEYDPTGASFVTARQDGLAQKGIVGVKASQRMAETDARNVLAHKEKLVTAARQFALPPALLAAIASRESRGGAVLKGGFGDGGNGFGLMQVDKRSHNLEGLPDPSSLAHIMQAAGILETFRAQVARRHPDWPDERQLQGGVAAYNAGVGTVQTLEGMDKGTTGDDYSNDVWARARFFAALLGTPVPFTPSATVAALKPVENITVPSPAMAEVEGGASKLQRGQQGAAIRELQEMLMTLKYLELTEEQKATGLGIFGPRTETALQSFQRDVYLPPSGVLEIVTITALRQVVAGAVKRGADNQIGVVRRMQDRLVELKKMSRTLIGKGYGAFGQKTEGALREFQKEQKLKADGVYTVETYLALRASAPFAPPVNDVGSGDDTIVNVQLPNAGPGFFAKGGATSRSVQFCTERVLNRLMAFAAVWMSKHPDRPLRIGEMSVEGGGKFGAHVGAGHTQGFAVDIGLFRKDGQNLGTNFKDKATYDQKLARELIAALDESPNVFLMIFNDTDITAGPKLRRGGPHNDHVHVEFRKR